MELKKQNVMFLLRATQHGGTENVVIQLCKILKPHVNKIIVCAADGFDTSGLKLLNIEFYKVNDIENKTPKNILHNLICLEQLIKRENITIMHTHHRMAAFYAYILSFKHSFIFINTSHNVFEDKRFFTKLIYRHSNLIACGEKVKSNLVEFFGVSESRITVICNAVESFEEEVQAIEKIEKIKKKGYILIGNVGRLTEQKGMKYFIQSLPLVLEKHSNVQYVVVGDGEERKELESLANNLGVSGNIIFLGYRKDIQNVIAQLDFIVLSSLWEGLPLIPLEAFSVGKTVIATAVDGTVEIIRDDVDGILIEPKNSEMMAQKINFLIDNPDIRYSFEKKAKKRYLEKFSFEQLEETYIKYYRGLIQCQK